MELDRHGRVLTRREDHGAPARLGPRRRSGTCPSCILIRDQRSAHPLTPTRPRPVPSSFTHKHSHTRTHLRSAAPSQKEKKKKKKNGLSLNKKDSVAFNPEAPGHIPGYTGYIRGADQLAGVRFGVKTRMACTQTVEDLMCDTSIPASS